MAEPALTPLTGAWARLDGYSIMVIEVLAGVTVALLIVVAGSWWGRPVAVPVSSAPPPTEKPPVVLSETAVG